MAASMHAVSKGSSAAFFASSIGEVVKTSQTFLGLFTGPVLALFPLGILTKRGSFVAWLPGVMVALPTTLWIQRGTDVHFVYYFPISFLLSLSIAMIASVFFPARQVDPALTLRGSKNAG